MSNVHVRLLRVAQNIKKLTLAKHWVQDAVKNPGRLHEHFGIPEGEKIPAEKINKEIARLHKKKDSGGSLSKEETSLLRALQLGKRLKKM
jgi:hypothetical protein